MPEVIRFPNRYEEARKRGEEFQRLSPEERIRAIAEMHKQGWAAINASPQRDAILKRMDEEEEEWRRIQTRLFTEYLAKHPEFIEDPMPDVVVN